MDAIGRFFRDLRCRSHSLLHGELLLSGDLLPLDDPGLDQEEDPGDVLEHDPDETQAEGPGEVVVLPVGQEVPPVTQRAEDDEGDSSQGACK